jgi:hypothetical protein
MSPWLSARTPESFLSFLFLEPCMDCLSHKRVLQDTAIQTVIYKQSLLENGKFEIEKTIF